MRQRQSFVSLRPPSKSRAHEDFLGRGFSADSVRRIAPAGAADEITTGDVEFNRDVRPNLARACWRAMGLTRPVARPTRLDHRVRRRRIMGQSRVVAATLGSQRADPSRSRPRMPSERMPPPNAGEPGRRRESRDAPPLDRSRRDTGTHWSLIAAERPAIPQRSRIRLAAGPDRSFVFDRFDREEGPPRPMKRTGSPLAGASARSDRAAADPGPKSTPFWPTRPPTLTRRLVDRLLASPRFGEQMARRGSIAAIRRHQRLSIRRRAAPMWRVAIG